MSLSWADADEYCLDTFGDHLATITSDDENLDVRMAGTEAGISTSGRLWFGFNDIDVEGTWEWADGTDVSYLNWSPGNPNDANSGQDCSSMYPITSTSNGYNITWDDNFCDDEYPFVCNYNEMNMMTTTSSVVIVSSTDSSSDDSNSITSTVGGDGDTSKSNTLVFSNSATFIVLAVVIDIFFWMC